jgi:hypothetical protein
LAQAKLNPAMLAQEAPGKSKPDYLIKRGSVRFAVEAKRASHGDAALRLVDDAGDQIRKYDRPGIIIVDATDCISIDPFQVTGDSETVVAIVRADLDQLHERLVRHIENYTRSNKFHQVAMLMTFARYWPWVRGETLHRAAGLNFRASSVFYRWSRQVTALTKEVQDGVLRGVEQLTGNRPTYRYY